jgi:lipopolysaccharide/colanic/teichoic acid biosynthesis glycosyltransferase
MLRVLDFIFSAFALFVLTPFLLPVGILLRFTGEGKVFYAQTRIGLNGKTFRLLKFATMLENSPNIGAGAITVTNDSRVLPVGRFLRKTKINELPQILNI